MAVIYSQVQNEDSKYKFLQMWQCLLILFQDLCGVIKFNQDCTFH
jgi:hypothetical protein